MAVMVGTVVGLHVEHDVGVQLVPDVHGLRSLLKLPVHEFRSLLGKKVAHLPQVLQPLFWLVGNTR